MISVRIFCFALIAALLLAALPALAQTPVYTQTTNDYVTGDNTPVNLPLCTGSDVCWQPDLGADKYTKDMYERPMGNGSGAKAYFPELDIITTQIGADATYFYFRINMYPTNPTPNSVTPVTGLPYMYTWEINFDGADVGGDARADIWVIAENPNGNLSTSAWSDKGVQVYLDNNDDVGGTLPLVPQGPTGAGDGYEQEMYKEDTNSAGVGGNDAVVARLAGTNNRSLELAVRRDFLARVKSISAGAPTGSIPVVSASFRGNAGKSGAGTTRSNLLLHDKFGRLSNGSPYPYLTDNPGVACPDTTAGEAALSTAQKDAFDSGNNTSGTANACYPHGGNVVEFDNSGGVDELASGADFYLDSISISGTVFEDVNYGGGLGRSLATSGGAVRPGARVELYKAGAFHAFTTTDASGNFSFGGQQQSVSYSVRVVNSTVTSSRTGAVAGLLPVQTFRTSGLTSNVGTADTARVGGEAPDLVDAGSGASGTTVNTTTGAFTAGISGQAQSFTTFAATTANITGINFGFNFDTIVNVNDSGQGSLRQFITNANTLTGEASLAQSGSYTNLNTAATVALASGVEQSIFMIPSGSAVAGLRAGLTSGLTSGRAIIPITSVLPTLSTTMRIEGGTQTFNVGNTNDVTLGTGGTVGVGATVFPQMNGPEVELRDGATGAGDSLVGLNIGATNVVVRGMSLVGFGGTADSDTNANILIGNFTGATISQNVLGATAISFADPGATLRGSGDNIRIAAGGDTGTISNNLIGYSAGNGIGTSTTASTGWTVEYNEVRGNGVDATARNGIEWNAAGTTTNTLRYNLVAANTGSGIEFEADASDSFTLTQNTITANGNATEPGGVRVNSGDTNTVSLNIIHTNTGPGVKFLATSTANTVSQNQIHGNTHSGIEVDDGNGSDTVTNTLTQNSIYNNTRIGIDLLLDAQNGAPASPYYTQNDDGDGDSGGNAVLNFPQIASITISGGNTTITGIAPAASAIEFFISDSDATGFGEGQTYLVTKTEGSGDDTAAGTGTSMVTCGAGAVPVTMNNFSFTFATPGGVSNGTSITSTATLSANTSEFSCNTMAYEFPSLTFLKTVAVTSDPANGGTNPKNIPGAEVLYTLRVTNSGGGNVSNNSLVITDPLPANTDLFVGDLGAADSGPIVFVQGTPTSALAYTFTSLASTTDDVDFSNNNCSTFVTPNPPYDPTINCIRLNPKGTMAGASGGNNPYFDLRFRVRIR